ncbi:MAG: ABC transporter permease [bacterium]
MKKTGFIANYGIALFLIIGITFVLPRLMKGDPLLAIYGEEALVAMTPQLKAEITRRFSLDQPLIHQFFAYIASLFKGDLGFSYYYNAPVFRVILGALPWTLLLAGVAMFLSTLFGCILGIESGYRRTLFADKAMLTGLISLNGFPDFFIGILLLLLFGVSLGVFPLSGAMTAYAGKKGLSLVMDILHHLALPLVSLVLVRMTATYLITRNTMITTLGKPFITTARAKGCREGTIRYRHAGRDSLLPVVTLFGVQLAHIITATLFVEIVFSYPGVGSLLYNSLSSRDYPMIQGILLMVACGVLIINLLIDLLYPRIDPRVAHAC